MIKNKLTLKMRLIIMFLVTALPLTSIVLSILGMINNYSDSYNKIMANLKVANDYNTIFKEQMEYSMYRVMIGLIDADKFQSGDIKEGQTEYATVLKNPLDLIEKAKMDFRYVIKREPDSYSDIKINGILSCLDSLETAVNKMIENSKQPGKYDENNAIWENDIQGLCSMIQDYINQYIHYEILNMEELQNELEIYMKRIVKIFMTLLSGIVIAGIGISIMITKSVTKPIDDMKKTAERLGRGELEARATLGNLEEINILSRTFNKMSDEISALMEKTKQEQKNLRIAELKLHQEQINPHFLYNTLDSIVWMAEGGKNKQVVEMTTDLSDFFRTILSNGNDFITIEEEESHIRSYLKIQKIRYEDVLDYEILISPEIKEKIVLKMILQPVVENALYHGIKNKRGGGTIVVKGYMEKSNIVFEVKDDGIGMDEQTLEKLRKKLKGESIMEIKQKGGFGMNNVAKRIYMYYGAESDISVISEKNKGTCVKIILGDRK